MKKRVLLVLCLCALAICGGATTFALADSAPAARWTTDTAGFTAVDATDNKQLVYQNITRTAGSTADTVTLTYSQSVNFDAGAWMKFAFPSVDTIDIDAAARTSGANFITFRAVNGQDKGIEIKILAIALNDSDDACKMQADVYYIDPTIERTAESPFNVDTGKVYLETIETFINVTGAYHYIDLHKEEGMWFFAYDTLTAKPIKAYNDLSLADCTVTITYHTKTKAHSMRAYPFTNGIYRQYCENGFMQFGSDVIEYLSDDTVRYRIKDKRAAQFPGSLIRYREQLISTVGYDVRRPIHIEYSYDVSNASAVWYAVGLGRPDVLNSVEMLMYNVFGYAKKSGVARPVTDAVRNFSDRLAAQNDGIMFQTTTGMAQPTYREQNSRLSPYNTHSPSAGNNDRSSIDLLTFIVKEDGTDMYMNGKLVFDNLITKLSDFASNGYLAYPYFHFFEDKASTVKGNTVVIKGINAPRRADEKALRVKGESNTDLTVQLEGVGDGSVTLHHYTDPTDASTFAAVDAGLYSYDAQTSTLTVKYGYFAGKAYDVHNLYVRNGSGSEELSVRFADPTLVTLAPTIDPSVWYWKARGGIADLVVPVDIHNGTFVSFSGGGILKSQYTVSAWTDGKGTVTLSKDYLNGKSAGTFTYTVKTTNVEEEVFSCTFKVVINDTGLPPQEGDTPDDKDNSASPKQGCGGQAQAGGLAGMAVLLAFSAGMGCTALRKRKV